MESPPIFNAITNRNAAEIVLHQVIEPFFGGFLLRHRSITDFQYEISQEHIKPENQDDRQNDDDQKKCTDAIDGFYKRIAIIVRFGGLNFPAKLCYSV
jgi:hypothetical protein